jgi:hypothetical protein
MVASDLTARSQWQRHTRQGDVRALDQQLRRDPPVPFTSLALTQEGTL